VSEFQIIFHQMTPHWKQQANLKDLESLPKNLQAHVSTKLDPKEQAMSIVGYQMALDVLRRNLKSESISLSPLGRPTLEKGDMNLSHSWPWVVCAFSPKKSVGIDVEVTRPVPSEDFHLVFSQTEMDFIHGSSEPVDTIFSLWTAKEAAVKCEGRGMHLPLKEFSVTPNNKCTWLDKTWFLSEIKIADNVKCHLASSDLIDKRAVELNEWKRSGLTHG
jgi:4'-phosphopantetheinyl transferase